MNAQDKWQNGDLTNNIPPNFIPFHLPEYDSTLISSINKHKNIVELQLSTLDYIHGNYSGIMNNIQIFSNSKYTILNDKLNPSLELLYKFNNIKGQESYSVLELKWDNGKYKIMNMQGCLEHFKMMINAVNKYRDKVTNVKYISSFSDINIIF